MKKTFFPRHVWGWALYDFANSSYSTSMITVIFSVYFVKMLVPEGGVHWGPFSIPAASVWSYLIALTMMVVVILAPVMGSLADHRSAKKQYLLYWTLIGVVGTLALYGATPGRLIYGMVFTFLSFLGYEMAQVFYNGLINDVSEPDNKGGVSGFGFALGYIGGGVALAIHLLMITKPEWVGLAGADPSQPTRACFLMVGIWWMVFSIPMFLWVKDRRQPKTSTYGSTIFKQFFTTIKKILQMKDLSRFLLAFLIYNDGIQTLLIMASIFGAQALGMTTSQLALCILVIQFVAFFGAMIFGRLADGWSHKKVVLCTLVVYSVVALWAIVMRSALEFWIMGIIVGLVLGGSQSASRSLYARMIPQSQSGELFAFYSIAGKAAAFIGPLTFGFVTHMAGLRGAVALLSLFFIGGGLLLLRVNESQGNERALEIQSLSE